MWELVFGGILLAYVTVDSLVYLRMRKVTLDYWHKKEPNQPSLYTYVPLVNLPMAILAKIKSNKQA
jgi:hypothetical protein